LPIITPPFVVGLGLILLFGRAGIVNQLMEWGLGVTPTRWFYGALGIWLAQMLAFTPIAYLIMRGVVQAVAPSLEEVAQTLRASRWQVFRTVTLPLLKPGLANAILAIRLWWAAHTLCCRPRFSLPSWGRSSTKAALPRWRAC